MTNKELVRDCFVTLLEQAIYDETIVEKYFSRDYVQCVDGVVFDYHKFKIHIQKLKELTTSLRITFNHVAEDGETVFTNHTVTVVRKDGRISTVKVIATFIIKENKIVYCDELTRHLEGAERDTNFGSVV